MTKLTRITLPTFTPEDLQAWYRQHQLWHSEPCWADETLRAAWPRGKKRLNALDVLRLEAVPLEDRLWVVLREDILSPRALRWFACDCAERTLSTYVPNPDARSVAAIQAARSFALGKLSAERLHSARMRAQDVYDEANGHLVDVEAVYAASIVASDDPALAANSAVFGTYILSALRVLHWAVKHLTSLLEQAVTRGAYVVEAS